TKIHGAGRTWRSSKAAPDFAGGQPLAMANSDGGRNTGKDRTGVPPFPLTRWGVLVVPPGLRLFRMGRKEAGLRGES
ncbi:hypothetical protein, partial [Citrobacter koseri]